MREVYVTFRNAFQLFKSTKLIGMFFCVMSPAMFASAKAGVVPAHDVQQNVQQQQYKEVRGIVVDDAGQPIIGANIKVKGTNVISVTDLNGKFSLYVPEGNKLSISYIGYVSVAVVPKGTDMKIVLQDDTKALNEVVVVGYGTQKLKNVTGSMATISEKDIADIPVSNIAEALSGKIPGLTVSGGGTRPGDTSSLSVRQSSELGYAKQGNTSTPLIVIDDVVQVDPSTGMSDMTQFNLLDPSEIESITVLRDASAAIYGSRAAQGAIIVTTKRGHSGAPKISYSGKFGVTDAVSHSKEMSAYEYGTFANSFLQSAQIVKSTDTNRTDKLFSDDELESMKGLNNDWLKEAWKSAFTQSHAVNVSGGSEKATYFAGLSYYNQGANLGNQDYNKYTFRTGVDISLTSDLKFSASLAANQSDVTTSYTKVATISDSSYGSKANGYSDYVYLAHMPKYIPWSTEISGQEYYVSPSGGPNMTTSNGAINTRGDFGAYNYFALNNSGSKATTKSNSWNANFSFTYSVPFVKGLSFRGMYAMSRSASVAEEASLPYTLAYLNNMSQEGKHLYSAWNASDYVVKTIDKSSSVLYDNVNDENRQMNFFINYQRKFGQHNIDAMASVERSDAYTTSARQAYDTPTNYSGTSSTAGTINTSSYVNKYESGTLSYLGRVNYSYMDRYMLQFLFRSDASTKFAPENYWGFFPSASAGWVISEEKFWKKNLPWVEYMKLRASWGKTGRDNIAPWEWRQTFTYNSGKGYQFGTNGGVLGYGYTPNKSPNRNVHWDVSNKFDFGFDSRFLNSRLSATVDLYYEINSDILNSAVISTTGIPFYIGGGYSEENNGRIDTYGAEFALTWRDHIGEVKYHVGVNFGFSGNKVKDWPTLAASYPSSNNMVVGGHTSDYMPAWGYKVWKGTSTGDGILRNQADIDSYWAYLQKNAGAGTPSYFNNTTESSLQPGMLAYQDLGGDMVNGKVTAPDGKITNTGADLGKLAKSNKTHGFTTQLGFEWNGLTFDTQISTSWGGLNTIDVVNIKGTKTSNPIWSPEYYFKDMFDATTNPKGKYPNLGCEQVIGNSVSATSDFWQISTFRCYVKNISIGYTLPKKWTQPLRIESARLSILGNNLWDFYNPYPNHYRNMYNTSYAYPTMRTWSLGVNVSF